MAPSAPRIAPASTPEDLATVRELFTEYAQSLGFSLCFQGFDQELALADAVIAAARERGYRAMRLDTLAKMAEANALYDRLGFRDIPPYYANPLPDTRYRELMLL